MKLRMIGLLGVLALVLASCGGTTPQASGPTEGIQVHGDWVIDIYNEDGTLDEHVEFSNALSIQGAETIVNVLTRTRTAARWMIKVREDFNTDDLCPSDGFVGCNEIVPTPELVDTNNTNYPDTIRLNASTTIEVGGDIYRVYTTLEDCAPTTAPSSCTSVGGIPFTAKDVTTLDWDGDGTPDDGPIPVSPGQIVTTQVEISFTSG